MGQDEAVRRFLDSLRVRNFTEKTIRQKERHVCRFRLWLFDEGGSSALQAVSDARAREYRRQLAAGNATIDTWTPLLSTIKHFFAWAARNDLVLVDPFETIDIPRRPRTLAPYLTQNEVRALLDATPATLLLLHRAVLELLYSSALRIGELVNLDLSDVDLSQGVVFIRRGKGKKDRVVPMGRLAATFTARYIREMRLPAPSQKRALFVDESGQRLDDSFIRRSVLRPALERAEIAKHVTPHVLRHSCAVHLLENGASVREVQQLLGHVKLSTTQRYTNVIPLELKKAHAAAHPAEHQQRPAETSPTRTARNRWDAWKNRPGASQSDDLASDDGDDTE